MLRDKLLARLAEMGDAPDHQRLAAEVLGIRGAPPELARRLVAQALVLEDRREVGSEIEALLREASLIQELQPPVNVQIGAPDPDSRDLPRALWRDILVLQPSIEPDSIELIAAAVDGRWMMQRTRRNGADLAVH